MLATFSNWLFIWFFLFYLKIIPYNPILFLICGYIITFGFLFYLYKNNAPRKKLIKFIIINIFLKLSLIIIILYTYGFSFSVDDGLIAITLYSLYLIYMLYINNNPISQYNNIAKSYIDNKIIFNASPISKLYDYIYEKFFHLKK